MRPQYVYFVRFGEHLKIGISRSPRHRIRNMMRKRAITHPDGMDRTLRPVVLGAMLGNIQTEIEQHEHLKHLRVDGVREWYHATPELLAYVDSLPLMNGVWLDPTLNRRVYKHNSENYVLSGDFPIVNKAV